MAKMITRIMTKSPLQGLLSGMFFRVHKTKVITWTSSRLTPLSLRKDKKLLKLSSDGR